MEEQRGGVVQAQSGRKKRAIYSAVPAPVQGFQ